MSYGMSIMFVSLGGENNIGFGSDFDGIAKRLEICGITGDYYILINELLEVLQKESSGKWLIFISNLFDEILG